jgi:tRNA-dihydrouridine synthase B
MRSSITGKNIAPLLRASKTEIILRHIESLYEFYGEYTGVRMARKHLGGTADKFLKRVNCGKRLMAAENSASQFAAASAALNTGRD